MSPALPTGARHGLGSLRAGPAGVPSPGLGPAGIRVAGAGGRAGRAEWP